MTESLHADPGRFPAGLGTMTHQSLRMADVPASRPSPAIFWFEEVSLTPVQIPASPQATARHPQSGSSESDVSRICWTHGGPQPSHFATLGLTGLVPRPKVRRFARIHRSDGGGRHTEEEAASHLAHVVTTPESQEKR